jgi:transcriptional regulator with XRE-family HTH domain
MATETFSRHLIRIARRKAGLTQAVLAARAGTSQAAVSVYESGRRSPSVDTLSRLLAAAGFEMRMRLAAPDTHTTAREMVEKMLPPDQVAEFNSRERTRSSRA